MGEGFRTLTTWQKAYELVLDIYMMTKYYPRQEMFGLVSQIRRASLSVAANIGKGMKGNIAGNMYNS